jgi:four helix bundle protein
MFIQFLSIARGSAAEVETQLEIVKQLGLATSGQLERPLKLCDEISRMASSLQRVNRKRRGI